MGDTRIFSFFDKQVNDVLHAICENERHSSSPFPSNIQPVHAFAQFLLDGW